MEKMGRRRSYLSDEFFGVGKKYQLALDAGSPNPSMW